MLLKYPALVGHPGKNHKVINQLIIALQDNLEAKVKQKIVRSIPKGAVATKTEKNKRQSNPNLLTPVRVI